MKEKLNYYLLVAAGLATIVAVISVIVEPGYLIFLSLFGLYLIDNRHRIKPAILTLAFITIVSFPLILLIKYLLYNGELDISGFEEFIVSAMLSIIILIIPFSVFYNLFIKVLIVANHEKDHFILINSFPKAICKRHLVKTKQYSVLGFKFIHCRKSRKCFGKGDVKALNIVGLIGDLSAGEECGEDYYVTLWDYENNKILDADYDIIEIRESEEIKDFDGVINKVITFFYNELDRFKPINEVIIRIVGNPQLSLSTKRLLEKRFRKIEYSNLK